MTRTSYIALVGLFFSSPLVSWSYDCTLGHLATFYGHAANAVGHISVVKAYNNAVLAQESQTSGSSSSGRTYTESEKEWNSGYKAQKSEEASPSKISNFQVDQYTGSDGDDCAELTWSCEATSVQLAGSAKWSSELHLCRYSDFSQFVKEYSVSGYKSYSKKFDLSKNELIRNVKYYVRVRRVCTKSSSNTQRSSWAYYEFVLGGSDTPELSGTSTAEIKAMAAEFSNFMLNNASLSHVELDVSKNADFSSSLGTFYFPVSSTEKFFSFDLSALGASTTPYYVRYSAADTSGNTTAWNNLGQLSIPKSSTDGTGPTMTTYSVSVVDDCLSCEWQEASDPSGIKCYEVNLSTNSDFSDDVIGQYQDTCRFQRDVTDITPQTFYIRVRAQDGAGNWGAWGTTRSVVKTVPLVEDVTAIQYGYGYRFDWSPVENAASYDCQWSTDASFSSGSTTEIQATPAKRYAEVANDGATYLGTRYFRVRACTSSGQKGEWTAISLVKNTAKTGTCVAVKKAEGKYEGDHIGVDVALSSKRFLAVGGCSTRLGDAVRDQESGGVRSLIPIRTFDSNEISAALSATWYAVGGGNASIGGRVRLGRADTEDAPSITLTSPNAEGGGGFGTFVSFCDDSTLVVAAPCENEAMGRIYVYSYNGSSWGLAQTIEAPGAENENFAESMSASGDWLFVGCIGYNFDNTEKENFGACRVFHRDSSGMFRQTQILTGRLLHQAFGCCVSVSGDRAAVSAYRDWLYGGGQDCSGGAIMYRLEDNVWVEDGYLRPNLKGVGERNCGALVNVCGDWACIGGVGDSTVVTNGGSVVLFHRDNGSWTEVKRIYPYDGTSEQHFGNSIAIFNDILAVGAPDNATSARGAIYTYALCPESYAAVVPVPNASLLTPHFNSKGSVTFDCSSLLENGDMYELEMADSAEYSHPIVSVRGTAATVESTPLVLRAYVYRARIRKNGMWSNWSRDAIIDISNAGDTGIASYEIAFHANGGNGSMTNQKMILGAVQKLDGNEFVRSGYEFDGWAASASASASFQDEEEVLNLASAEDATVDLYATWKSVGSSVISLKTAVDCTSLSFTTGGSANWFGQTGETHDGTDAARSGAISHNESSWLQTTVTGPGTISFWWYANSESASYDYLSFGVDGTVSDKIGGTSCSWTRCSYDVSSGVHTLTWTYRKDGSVTKGEDAGFVDQISWTPKQSYTVTYDPGSYGSGSQQTATKTEGVALTLAGAIFTRSSYTQTGWATSDGGEQVYALGESYTANEAVTLYPVWTANVQDGFQFDITGGKAIVTAYSGDGGHVAIPSTLGGMTVAGIGDNAFYDHSDITSVTIPSSVTSIGEYAFCGCGLESVTMPSSVTSIGTGAFSGCLTMKSIYVESGNANYCSVDGVLYNKGKTTLMCCPGFKTECAEIPSTVTSIGAAAFFGSALTSVTIPSGVTSVGEHAFAVCTRLASLAIPSSVTSIGADAFLGCIALKTVYVDAGDETRVRNRMTASGFDCSGVTFQEKSVSYTVTYAPGANGAGTSQTATKANGVDLVLAGAIFTRDGYTQTGWATSDDGAKVYELGGSYTTDAAVTLYPAWTPDQTVLRDGGPYTNTVDGIDWVFTLSDGKATLGTGTSWDSGRAIEGLTSGAITIPSVLGGCPVTSIDEYAFSYCDGLTSVTIPEGVTSIGSSAFEWCTGLTSVTIPEGVTSIGSSAFEWCTGLTSVTIPSSVTSIGKNAFLYCSGLTSVTIPEGVTSIGVYAFRCCSGLTSVTIPSSVTSIDNTAFSDCSGLTSINVDASNQCYASVDGVLYDKAITLIMTCPVKKTSVTIPEGVTSIGNDAFEGCSGLTSVTIPSSVTSIDERAFGWCSGLTCVDIPSSVTSIGEDAFLYCRGLTSVTIPSSVTSIGERAFAWCSGLTRVDIPSSVTSIGAGAFSGCSGLTSINVDAANQYYASVDGVLYDKAITILMAWPGKKTSVTIPSSVTSIGRSAFAYCRGLTSVTIASGVTSIGNSAFYGCSKLTSVTIPSSVTSIGSSAFAYCRELATVYVDACDATRIETLMSNSGFTTSGLTFIETSRVMYEPGSNGTGASQTAVRTNGVDFVLAGAIFTRDGYTQTGWATRDGGEQVYALGDTYADDAAITLYPVWAAYALPDGGPYMETVDGIEWVFSVSNGVATVADNSSNLSDYEGPLAIPGELGGRPVIAIGEGAFKHCAGMTQVGIPPRVTSIGMCAFDGCSGLASVQIPQGVTNIGDWAFEDCAALASVTIPSGVKIIGQCAFLSCSALTSVDIPASVTSIGECAFVGCEKLMAISVDGENRSYCSSDGVLYDRAKKLLMCFPAGRTGSFTVPPGVTTICEGAFAFCAGLTNVTLATGVTTIDSHAFNWCVGLASLTIPSSVTSMGVCAFDGCSGLKTVYVDAGDVERIGNLMFSTWSELSPYLTFEELRPVETKVATPVISPADGTMFADSCTITITCATEGASIYYTTNGNTPKLSAKYLYSAPITVSHSVKIKAIATKTGLENSDTILAAITRVEMTLGMAIGATDGMTVTTGGDSEWEPVQDSTAKHGGYSAKSGLCGDEDDNGQSWLQVAVNGSGTLTFWAKTSCEHDYDGTCTWDHLEVYADGVELEDERMDGETDWTQKTIVFDKKGSHTVKWLYAKDDSDYEGEDCAWIDGVVWAPAGGDPFPALPDSPTTADVEAALEGAADDGLGAHIATPEAYDAFRAWAGRVKPAGGGSAAGLQAVKEAPNAWLSYALASDTLIATPPEADDLKVEAFAPSATSGKFDFTIGIDNVTVGADASADNLAKVLGVEGGSKLDAKCFDSANVSIAFDTPVDGKVKLTAGPKDASATSFFMRVKLTP